MSARAQAFDASQYAHTAWRVQDGAPGAVRSLAQGRDGILWIGSERGLFQFDGVRFERFEPPADQPQLSQGAHVLLALPDSSLWIGHFGGGVSTVHRGRVITYGASDGLPGGTVTAITRDSAGAMWAATTRGLARLEGTRWKESGSSVGYPGGFTEPVLVDARGSVWAASQQGIFVLPRGAERFEKRSFVGPTGRDAAFGALAIAPDGSIWAIQHGLGLFPIANAQGEALSTARLAYADTAAFSVNIAPGHPAIVTSMTGRLVQLWIPDLTSARVPLRERAIVAVTPFSRQAGMSGDRVMAALYDREGSLWVGTPTGIDRFRPTKLTPVTWPGHVNWPVVAADTNGAVLVAARNGAPTALFAIGERVVARRDAPKTLTSIYRDTRGTVWIGGESKLWERNGSRLVPVALPAAPSPMSPSLLQVHAIARDRDDGLWVSITYDGVYRRRTGGEWERFGTRHGLGNLVANAITTDSSGRTWLGYPTGQVALVIGDSVRMFSDADGIRIGSVLAISIHGDRVWIAGQSGVAALAALESLTRNATERRGTFVTIVADGEPLRGISGIVETPTGELWLNGADGVTRIAADEVRRALTEPGYRVRYERFDYRDGIEPPAPQVRPLPSAIVGTDGRLWFTSAGGVSWIDPRAVRHNAVSPAVHLKALSAGGRSYATAGAAANVVTLPPRTTPVSISYTAYSLAVPERVQFRHRLEGLDTTWQHVGGRREAFYTNLPPGRYRFHVIAANDDGVWNTEGAWVDFAIQPAWNQTLSFLALLAAAIGAVPAVAAVAWQRRRSRLAAERAQAQFEATLAERTRVARELHDTLLGDMAGVAMQLSAGAKRVESLGATAPIIELLSNLGAQVQRSLVEARRSVTAMRSAPESLPSLHEQLADVTGRTFGGTEIDARVEHMGSPRRYAPTVEAEIVGLATEAMSNARQHAGCRAVTVTCQYAPRALSVHVRDDGRGFDISRGSPPGHWGLIGMRERAAAIGATLTITSSVAAGTEVTLVVPGGPGRWTWWSTAVPSTKD